MGPKFEKHTRRKREKILPFIGTRPGRKHSHKPPTAAARRPLHSCVLAIAATVVVLLCMSLFCGESGAVSALDNKGIEMGASFRTTGAVTQNYGNRTIFEKDNDTYLQSILRITAEGGVSARTSLEAHLVTSFTYTGSPLAAGGVGSVDAGYDTRYRTLDTTWELMESKEKRAGAVWFDRLNLKFSLPQADICIGRQAISFGKTYFWAPLDIYLPFAPSQFDRDYKPGVDAVRIDIPLGPLSGLNAIYAAGRRLDGSNNYLESGFAHVSWFGSSILLRGFMNMAGWDAAFQAGKVYGGWHTGLGIVGDLGPCQLRMEGALFRAEGDGPVLSSTMPVPVLKDNFSAVIGVGLRRPSSLDIEAECFFNSGGESSDINLGLQRLWRGALLQAGKVFGGVSVSYELTPILIGQVALIYSQTDDSMLIQPMLTWSTSDDSELVAGAVINRGDRPAVAPSGAVVFGSEFGAYPDMLFAQFKIYF